MSDKSGLENCPELAYLKQIMLIHTQMDVMMVFMAAEKTTMCILLAC